MIYRIMLHLLKKILKKPEVEGLKNIDSTRPGVFVANHLGYYGPVKLFLFTETNLVPWVNYEITEKSSCKNYLLEDYVEPTMRLKPPISNLVAALIAPFCLGIMKKIMAIPVYHGTRNIGRTFDLSVQRLQEGKNLLIFPEFPDRINKNRLGDFQTGFIRIAKDYCRIYGKSIVFYPVVISRKNNLISFQKGFEFNCDAPYSEEKIKIINGLKESIERLADR